MCDTGDGWNLVYAVAYTATQPVLELEGAAGKRRLHIARDGSLTIYPVEIARVPRRWRDRHAGDSTPSRVVPDEPLQAALIEPPIVVPPRS